MTQIISDDLPADYPQRIKNVREISDLTQAQLAEMIGVSFATVNRWENKQTRPNNLSWRRILEIENSLIATAATSIVPGSQAPKQHYPDFSADPETVWAVAEAHRLSNSHLVNPFICQGSLGHRSSAAPADCRISAHAKTIPSPFPAGGRRWSWQNDHDRSLH